MALISNIVTCEVNKQFTTLQIALSVLLHDKTDINEFNKFLVCCNHDEYIRFKGSVAKAASDSKALQGLKDSSKGGELIQAVADNFDTDTIHCLALLLSQANSSRPEDASQSQTTIRRIKKEELKEPLHDAVEIR